MEFNANNYDNSVDYKPISATIQLMFTDGSKKFSDTVDLNPAWAAKFIKKIRGTSNNTVWLGQALPTNSPELKPFSRSVRESRESITPSQYRGWLRDKPSNQKTKIK